MTTKLLKYALKRHFIERGRAVLNEEIDKLIDDWHNVADTTQNETDAAVANERIAVLSGLKNALVDVAGEDITAETFGITTEITTTYLPSEDVTVIWKHAYIYDECISRTIVGFYYGEPDEKSTETFSFQSLTAEFLY